MEINIIEFESGWEKDVCSLISGIQRNEFGLNISIDAQPDLLNIPDFYKKGSGNFWLAVHEKQLAGTIALLDIGNKQGAIRKMFVHQLYRGKEKGTAGLLLAALEQSSLKAGVNELFLGTTAKFHAAHRFYEKNGFENIQIENLPPTFPVMNVDTIFYRKKL